jgi:pyruvate formate lyase activating enzyme
VRQARDGGIVLTSFGRNTGMAVDPIEKKPLNHFYPGSTVLSFGTAGCNLGCRFCQNWHISKTRQVSALGEWATPEEVASRAAARGCRSVAFTYNEPVIFAEYAIACAQEAHRLGLKTVAVTSGYISDAARPDFYRHIDAANVDLKAFSDAFYHKLCGGALQPVLDTLRYLKRETDVWLEITTLLIPGHNDSPAEINRQVDWILNHLGPDVPLHFTAFHPDFRMRDVPPTSHHTLTRAREQALAAGLRYVYTGNVLDSEGGSTYCATCGVRLIGRRGYQLLGWDLTPDGACRNCGSPLPGRFG